MIEIWRKKERERRGFGLLLLILNLLMLFLRRLSDVLRLRLVSLLFYLVELVDGNDVGERRLRRKVRRKVKKDWLLIEV